MMNTTTPKLVVCDLDQDLLQNREAEGALLDSWMAWERKHRPLLLFHSTRTVDELRYLLPCSVLPPADLLIGAGIGLLVRHSFWNHRQEEDDTSARRAVFAMEHLLASMASRALAQLHMPAHLEGPEFPKVENAALTRAGLFVTFASSGRRTKRASPNAALMWLLAELQLEPHEIRTYAPTQKAPLRPLKVAV